MRPRTLVYLYGRRLRVHAVQEALAGLGVAIGVALVFATLIAAGSVAGSAEELARAVTGAASLQLHARDSEGFDESLLARVQRLPGVASAAPLLEQSATVLGPRGRRVAVDLAGADTSLAVLDGLAHKLPRSTLAKGGFGLSAATAHALGLASSSDPSAGAGIEVGLALRGRSQPLRVTAILDRSTFGPLSEARVAVMQLSQLQRLAGLDHRVTRILVRPMPRMGSVVRGELARIAGGRIDVAVADQDVGLLRQALLPNDQASGLFAAVSALLGLLFAAAAMLLTVPERRRAIADLRLIGARRTAIAQMFLFQALLLGAAASLLGVLCGYALSRGVFHQSSGYLSEAFTLGTRTVVTSGPLALTLAGGVLVTCLVSAAPLLDLRRGSAIDAVYRNDDAPGNSLSTKVPLRSGVAATALSVAAVALLAVSPKHTLLACVLLALATVSAVPFALSAVLRAAGAFASARPRLTILPVALSSLRATTLRSLALASTGAVALFGSIALGGSRQDLLDGVQRLAHSYSGDADLWVGSPGDVQATVTMRDGWPSWQRAIARLPGVAVVRAFQGGFLTVGGRRAWIVARPPTAERRVLASQIVEGGASRALRRIDEGGWIAVSHQIAEQSHTGVGGAFVLPTPGGPARLRIAATTTNVAWSPGVVFMSAADYSRLWHTRAPSAFGVTLARSARAAAVKREIERALGTGSGLQVSSAHEREASIDALAREGLGKLGEISALLLLAAVLALAAGITSAIWQRRASLAGLRLSGARPSRLRSILLAESALMLGAGCAAGVPTGICGQLAIDDYLRHVTGFPLTDLAASLRPLELLAFVAVAVLALVAVPGWLASRVSPTVALNEWSR